MIEARTGLRLEVAKVAVRNMSRERPVDLAEGVLTNDAASVVDDPSTSTSSSRSSAASSRPAS